MNKEEILEEIMKLPKIETVNPICTMNSINVDALMSAFDRLNKIPNYNDLLKENNELKEQLESQLQEKEKIIEDAIEYNKEICKLYDCGMELSNAQTNLVILVGKEKALEILERK